MLEQKSAVKFISENKKVELICEADVALGDLHDILMQMKGAIVDKMQEAQKEEESIAEKMKSIETE
jgi:hypothetical protein